MSLVEASALYNLLAPNIYEGVVRQLEWQGPRDMARILAPVAMAGAVVADFAIGTGPLSGAFRRAGARRIIGVDASKNYLDHCMAKGHADEVHLVTFRAIAPPLMMQPSMLRHAAAFSRISSTLKFWCGNSRASRAPAATLPSISTRRALDTAVKPCPLRWRATARACMSNITMQG